MLKIAIFELRAFSCNKVRIINKENPHALGKLTFFELEWNIPLLLFFTTTEFSMRFLEKSGRESRERKLGLLMKTFFKTVK